MAGVKLITFMAAMAVAIGAPVFAVPANPTELNINILNKNYSNINTSLRLTINYIDGDGILRSINSMNNAGSGSSNTISWSVKLGKSNLYTMVAAKSGTAISITVRTYETLKITAIPDGTVSGNYTLDFSTVDITPPTITITSPQNITYNSSSVDLNFSVADEDGISWTGYSLDSQANVTSGNTTLTDLPDGQHSVTVYANDSVGNMGSEKVYFAVSITDTSPPTITITSPQNITYATSTINLNVSADEAIATWWYSLNSGANVTFTPHTTITGAEGSNTLIVYANDTVGNTDSKTVYFTVYSNLTTVEPRQTSTRVVLLANSVDYALNSDLFEFLTSNGIEVVHANAFNFDQYKADRFIVILGGPDAYEGVGEIVQQVLSSDEQDYLRTEGNRKMYVKTNTWVSGQVVHILAGSDRHQTRQATEENKEAVSSRIQVG